MNSKGDGEIREILLVMGIALLLVAMGIVIYSAMFVITTFGNTIPANTIPAWFAILIALVFAILGIALIVLGLNLTNKE